MDVAAVAIAPNLKLDAICPELEGQRERVIVLHYSAKAFYAIIFLLPIIINSSPQQMLPSLQRKKDEEDSTDFWHRLMVSSIIAMQSYK
jgi:hypothetical protein